MIGQQERTQNKNKNSCTKTRFSKCYMINRIIAVSNQQMCNKRSHFMCCLAAGHPHLEFLSITFASSWFSCFKHYLLSIWNHLSSLGIFSELHGIAVDLPKDFYIALTLCGVMRLHGRHSVVNLPIMPDLLILIHSSIDFAPITEHVFWTAALSAFFTFFQKSNLFPSSSKSFDPL